MANVKMMAGLQPGPGRPKTANVIKSVRQMMDDVGFNPFLRAIDMINDPETPRSIRGSLTQSLFQFYGHRLNALEVTGANGDKLETLVRIVGATKPDE